MLRLLLLVLITVPAAAAADDQRYVRANARLAHATPAYPHARLLVQEPIGGESRRRGSRQCSGSRALGRPATQQQVMGFYAVTPPGYPRKLRRRRSR
jgi:hypothetical protein